MNIIKPKCMQNWNKQPRKTDHGVGVDGGGDGDDGGDDDGGCGAGDDCGGDGDDGGTDDGGCRVGVDGGGDGDGGDDDGGCGVGVDGGGDGDDGGDDGYNIILKFSGVISSHLENFIPLLELALLFCLFTSVFMFHRIFLVYLPIWLFIRTEK